MIIIANIMKHSKKLISCCSMLLVNEPGKTEQIEMVDFLKTEN